MLAGKNASVRGHAHRFRSLGKWQTKDLSHPLHGRDTVARGLIGLLSRAPEGTTFEVIEANGLPALLVRVKGQIVSVLTLEVEGDFIRALRTVANPDKLAHLNLPSTSDKQWRLGT